MSTIDPTSPSYRREKRDRQQPEWKSRAAAYYTPERDEPARSARSLNLKQMKMAFAMVSTYAETQGGLKAIGLESAITDVVTLLIHLAHYEGLPLHPIFLQAQRHVDMDISEADASSSAMDRT